MLSNQKTFSVLIPAAGNSERMGTPKLFLPFGNHTFVEELEARYLEFGCLRIILVVNSNDFHEIENRKIRFSANTVIVVNDNPELGRFHSIRLGLEKLDSGTTCFFQNIDNPFAGFEVLNAIAEKANSVSVVVPTFNKQRGHPIALGAAVWQALLCQDGNQTNLKEELMKFPDIEIPVNNPDILINMNNMDDFRAFFGKTL
ncbi:MAG: hypothetical protein A2W93_13940 [Bacteroidetes bacterium GWF2_43_63]|nr:MAG: hypothetical protein A2W94_00510 [Bacteroidetes bacterium GWE2_42_42]OFY52449.1 MAG: hypothetical protein A2W93_13940 [Bacteroidetes bacterium GWF2_43_63]HBG71355.1 hypothetical protein [Bacteroidales bacterium]HCY23930.1 hypothetical protein [Bacteroidales bacterium]